MHRTETNSLNKPFSLRVRIKAETTSTDAGGDLPAVEVVSSDGPDIASTEETAPEDSEGSSSTEDGSATVQTSSSNEVAAFEDSEGSSRSEADSATVQSSSSVKSAGTKKPAEPVTEKTKKSEGSMVGKINNLVTTDLGAWAAFFCH